MNLLVKNCLAFLISLGLLFSANYILANRLSIPDPDDARVAAAQRGGNARGGQTQSSPPQTPREAFVPAQAGQPEGKSASQQGGGQGAAEAPSGASNAGQSADNQGGDSGAAGNPARSQERSGSNGGTAANSGQGGTEQNADNGAMSMNSLSELGEERKEIEGEPLRIPEGGESPEFLDGLWSFQRTFRAPDGEEYRADFYFNEKGKGFAGLTNSKGELYNANAMAQLEDNALKIMTSPFVNYKTGQTFNSQYIECVNGADGAICSGTDGFGKWQDERMFSNKSKSEFSSFAQARSSSVQTASNSASTQSGGRSRSGGQSESDSSGVGINGDTSADRGSSGATGAPASRESSQSGITDGSSSGYAEMSGEGAELPPSVMENTEKAGSAGFDLAGLKGDWRYSRDMTRREDGRGLTLEFHFDNNGKGYSVIRDGAGRTWKANAGAQQFGKDLIRARTEAYSDGSGTGFYPTFMECRKGNPDMICDVSNGWLRMTDGRLVSLSAKKGDSAPGLADILDMETAMAPVVKQPSGGSIEDILGGMADAANSARQADAKNRKAAEASTSKGGGGKQAANLKIPTDSGSMSFLQGLWRCNTGLARTSDNQPVVVEFSFNKNGGGSAQIKERNGTVYTASAQANLRRNVLRINTSEFYAPRSRSAYNKCFIECRNQDGAAICSGENGGVVWRDATFTRIK